MEGPKRTPLAVRCFSVCSGNPLLGLGDLGVIRSVERDFLSVLSIYHRIFLSVFIVYRVLLLISYFVKYACWLFCFNSQYLPSDLLERLL